MTNALVPKLLEAFAGLLLVVCAHAVVLAQSPLDEHGERSSAMPVPAEPRPAEPGAAGIEQASPGVASYVLTAKLDAAQHLVSGTAKITWRNTARVAVDALYLHLYLNAFKNQESLFLRSPFEEGRSGARAEDWGYVDVRRVTVTELGGVDLWPARVPGSPEESADETDVKLPLPRAVAPGETLTLEIPFTSKLPSIVERTGHRGDFHFVAQWFPKLARLLPDGTWAHFSFHPQAEFFADFGDYDVTLDVPAEAVVGATGRRVESRRAGSRRIERYVAGSVHDFAWTAWPHFRERTARFGTVAVRLLYPPDAEACASIELTAVERGLARFSRLYGEYPYPTLTVVHPPEAAAAAGGMEYPTLITTGGAWYAPWLAPRALDSLVLHELLHQWFYGLVATDETRFPFLDEGITTYAEISALEALHGAGSGFRRFGLEVSATSIARALSVERTGDVPVASPAAAFPGFRALAALVYSRTGTALETMARVYGRDGVERAIGRYARRHRFGHPEPADFFAAVRAELGAEATRALELALTERGRIDYLVREIQTAPERPAAGIFDRKGGRETVAPQAAAEGRFRGRVVVYRRGAIELPVEVELVDARGERTRMRWDGRGTHRVFDWRGTAPLASARVDPDGRILLDDDLFNNAASTKPQRAWRTLERSSYAAALAFAWLGP